MEDVYSLTKYWLLKPTLTLKPTKFERSRITKLHHQPHNLTKSRTTRSRTLGKAAVSHCNGVPAPTRQLQQSNSNNNNNSTSSSNSKPQQPWEETWIHSNSSNFRQIIRETTLLNWRFAPLETNRRIFSSSNSSSNNR